MGIRSITATTALGALAAAATAFAAAPSAPAPASGTWRIGPNHSQPGPSLNEFKGAFKVGGGAKSVSGLHGVTQKAVNRGCTIGATVTMLGSAPIQHVVVASADEDVWAVLNTKHVFETVKLALKAPGAGSKARKVSGELRIYFPGGSATRSEGFTSYSNLTYESPNAGTCNLTFSITG